MDLLEIKVALQIARPRKDVYEAIVKQEKMSNYFISRASGSIEEEKTVEWTFPEFPDPFPVKVLKLKRPESIIFEWDGIGGSKTKVEIILEEVEDSKSLVRITEGKLEINEKGIQWYGQNTEGWTNFLACLKAYLEYGINLRKGGFDHLRSS